VTQSCHMVCTQLRVAHNCSPLGSIFASHPLIGFGTTYQYPIPFLGAHCLPMVWAIMPANCYRILSLMPARASRILDCHQVILFVRQWLWGNAAQCPLFVESIDVGLLLLHNTTTTDARSKALVYLITFTAYLRCHYRLLLEHSQPFSD
jgi:hypothetical protein